MEKKLMYQSLHGTQCSAAQLITEIVINNLAKKQKKVLPEKFWNSPDWKKTYKQEIILANSLLKVYPEQAVINAVSRSDTNWMTSLRIKKWIDYIKEEMQKITKVQNEAKSAIVIELVDPNIIRQYKPNSKLDRLKDF